MKTLLILLFLALPSQNSDSLPVANEIQMNELEKENDLLQRELLYYRAKEDYFAAALSSQATWFGVLVTVMLGIVALGSYGGFRWEVRKIQKEANKKTDEMADSIKEYEDRFRKVEFNASRSAANLFATIAMSNTVKELPVHELMFRLKAALHHGKAYEQEEDLKLDVPKVNNENYSAAIANLKKAETIIESLKEDPNTLEDLEAHWDVFKHDIGLILEFPNEEVKSIAVNIRYHIKRCLNQPKAVADIS